MRFIKLSLTCQFRAVFKFIQFETNEYSPNKYKSYKLYSIVIRVFERKSHIFKL